MIAFLGLVFLAFAVAVIAAAQVIQKKPHGFLWALIFAGSLAGFILMAGKAWQFFDYYAARHWVEVTLPFDAGAQGLKASAEFSLPRGDYLIVAERSFEDTPAKPPRARLRYVLEIPSQALRFEHEPSLNFELGVSQIRMNRFSLEKDRTEGSLKLEVLEGGSGNMRLKVVTDRALEM